MTTIIIIAIVLYFIFKSDDKSSTDSTATSDESDVSGDAYYKFGLHHHQQEDDVRALECFEKAANKGSIDAQYLLGWMYTYGERGARKNKKKGFKYYQEAAKQGHVESEVLVGVHYFNEDNYKDAIPYLTSAAENNIEQAQVLMGRIYMIDEYCNYALALKYFHQAKQHGNAEALFQIGQFYENGLSITKSSKMAIDYYKMAAEKGNLDAQVCLAIAYFDGDIVERDVHLAADYCKKAVAEKKVAAYYIFAVMNLTGEGMPKNKIEGLKYLNKAVDCGVVAAMEFLGDMYCKNGDTQDLQLGLQYYQQAVEAGSDNAVGKVKKCKRMILESDDDSSYSFNTSLENVETSGTRRRASASLSTTRGKK